MIKSRRRLGVLSIVGLGALLSVVAASASAQAQGKWIRHEDPNERIKAIEDLVRMGRLDNAGTLVTMLGSDPSPKVRKAAARGLGDLGAARGIAPLKGCAQDDPSAGVRRACADALRELDASEGALDEGHDEAEDRSPPRRKRRSKRSDDERDPDDESSDDDAPDDDAPLPRLGFQAAIGIGYSVPFGDMADGGVGSDTLVASQPGVFMRLGSKTTEGSYVGMYVGYGSGDPAFDCSDVDLACAATVLHYGVEVQKHFGADKGSNTWLSFGAGWEDMKIKVGDGGSDPSSGLEARFGFGVDARSSAQFGYGGYIDMAVGRYSTATENFGETFEHDWTQQAFHYWLSLGIRGVLFP